MDENKREEVECYYCYKTFSSSFMRNQHISYGHKGLMEIQSSKLYYNLLERIKKLEEDVSELKKEKMDRGG
jgi:hypothetical protein